MWEGAHTAVTSLGAQWEDTKHPQKTCPPQSLSQLAGLGLSHSSVLLGISSGMANPFPAASLPGHTVASVAPGWVPDKLLSQPLVLKKASVWLVETLNCSE